MKLQEALRQISDIRLQLARSERFRGYRSAQRDFRVPGDRGGAFQAVLIVEPMEQLPRFLTLWVSVALVSSAICYGDVWLRYRKSSGLLHRETTYLALGQFLPCVVAGALLTIVLARWQPQVAWALPGLWAILFSMGILASWRLLPPAIFGVAVYYLGAGLTMLSVASGPYALSPWQMPLLFGVGQLLGAAVLLLSERERVGEAQ